MTERTSAVIVAALAKVDLIADRGARVMRVAAAVAWLGAVAVTLVVLALLGPIGWALGLICLIPGWVLHRYGRGLADSFDAARIRAQLGDVVTQARTRLTEAVDDIGHAVRRPLVGGFRVIRTVRGLRSDLSELGIDVAGIAQLANPGSLMAVGASLLAAVGFWLLAVAALLARIVF